MRSFLSLVKTKRLAILEPVFCGSFNQTSYSTSPLWTTSYQKTFSYRKMSSSSQDTSYEAAITALNSLQSNAQSIQKMRNERQKNAHLNLPITRMYLERTGMTMDDLDSIKTIHVSGTKGKGSTCAFCESILRHHGLRTGFYSSPHLVSATERVRLDGLPIHKEKFTEYFWIVYNKVCRGRLSEDRPPYFQFLTILAFYIFWREAVEVAIIEVGIGGEYDCTNIIRNPVVTGITALGLDHTNILGNYISEIAWHKAGIMKRGVTTYIDGDQPEAALKKIEERGKEKGADVSIVPFLDEYGWGRFPMILGLHGQVQQRNASLALALSRHFLSTLLKEPTPAVLLETGVGISTVQPFNIRAEDALGLLLTDWPGRNQLIQQGRINYLLDGAHTEESIKACRSWFNVASKRLVTNSTEKIFKIMVFNTSGDRDPRVLLQPFLNSGLDLVIFCTNIVGGYGTKDQENFTTTEKIQISRCENHLHVWTKMQSNAANVLNSENQESECVSSSLLNFANLPSSDPIPGVIIPSISEALEWISLGSDPNLGPNLPTIPLHPIPQDLETADQIQVLITGSLHLVGGALACIQPDGLPERVVDPGLIARYLGLKNSLGSVPGMM
ncbi:folylpolyglutamate synthase, mitochondrial isoform X2 [Eurytemora carolleeae]|nr:folylpolyglutamate synthase, mitochondrial isoform X2 [Eurytemora carolleeae]|eukprot:XP_023346153.1 folylpolyglutamate synthase, mitochondrial-like isoform X2 [Eurytemora affinis]